MNSVDTRAPFFPNTKTGKTPINPSRSISIDRNSPDRAAELQLKTQDHAKVDIGDKIKDFSRIKKSVDAAPEINNSQKIADLKARIQAGTYEIDYDALADKMLETEY